MKLVTLSKGLFTKIDDDDFERVSKQKWYVTKTIQGMVYAKGTYKGNTILLHRFILNAPKGTMLDHINRDGLDNRKQNLRFCNYTLNNLNRGMQKSNRSGYRGVHWAMPNRKWRARIETKGRVIHLGYFDNLKEAAGAYNKATTHYNGRFSQLNIL